MACFLRMKASVIGAAGYRSPETATLGSAFRDVQRKMIRIVISGVQSVIVPQSTATKPTLAVTKAPLIG